MMAARTANDTHRLFPGLPLALLCQVVGGGLWFTQSTALGEKVELPLVIPHPQHIEKTSNEQILLGEGGKLLSQTIASDKGGFFDEALALIKSAMDRKGLTNGSRPAQTTIVLTTKASIASGGSSALVAPELSSAETAVLARNEQAYVIRMRPGDPAQLWIVGASPIGVYYGATTLVQLITSTSAGNVFLPCIEIQDYPDAPGRMCADWVLAWDWEINGYDWGDGLDAFLARCKRKIDLCSRYKVNRVRFLGGRISPGPSYMKDRYSKILRFARELNAYARRKGVALQYSASSFGIDHYGWGLPWPEPWILNRESYPDGKVYACMSGTTGGCLSNDALIEIIAQRQRQLVSDIEPSSIYLHNIDIAEYARLAELWKKRCPRCRQQFPDDEPYAPHGYAAAVARLYNLLTTQIRSVRNPATGYDASRDLDITFASPGYSYFTENDADWEKDRKHFSEIARQVTDRRNVQLTFREQFNRLDGHGLRTQEMARDLEQAGWPSAMFMFAVQGADFLDSPNLFVSSPVLTGIYRGSGTLYNFNGHAHSELQVLANVNYAWNHRAPGSVDPGQFPGPALRAEFSRYSTGSRSSDFLYDRFLPAACAALYGEKAAPSMVSLFRRERAKGPIVPLVAWIDYQWKNTAYDWRAQADRNRQARPFVDQAAAICDAETKPDLAWLSRCLDVSARICMLCSAVHQEKLDKAEIGTRADRLLAWLGTQSEFQITEPDGGDPALWRSVVNRIRQASDARAP